MYGPCILSLPQCPKPFYVVVLRFWCLISGCDMKFRVLGTVLIAAGALFCGCTEDQKAPGDETNQPQNTETNIVPATLAAKSYTFTVTASQNFAEPFSSGYVIEFNTETSYFLHPTIETGESPTDSQGNYSYDPFSRVVHLAETTPNPGRTIELELTFISATSGTARLVGRNGERQDAVFVQTSP